MIKSVKIENLRGIRHGELSDLGKLNVLTGPNASGKSTVLDALLIGLSKNPPAGVGRAVRRRPLVKDGSRWLFFGESKQSTISWATDAESGAVLLSLFRRGDPEIDGASLITSGASALSMVRVSRQYGEAREVLGNVIFDKAGRFEVGVELRSDGSELDIRLHEAHRDVRLVDTGNPRSLLKEYSTAAYSGRRSELQTLLATLIDDFERLEILPAGEGDFELAVSRTTGSVPLGASGEGIQAVVQLALSIATEPGGLVLVEEPEVYQHPRAIWQSALALLENVRRGVQMVVTTHSLELIDALLVQAGDTLDDIVLFNVLLDDGELKSGRRAGEQIAFARQTLERDLR